MGMGRNRVTKTFASGLMALALVFTAQSYAQVDERAKELLDGLQVAVQVDDFRSIDQTTVTTLYLDGEEFESITRSVVDFENERFVVITEFSGSTSKMVHQNGETTMTIDGEPVSTSSFSDSIVEGMFDVDSYIAMFEGADDSATYDGEVSYGDVLAGIQVTYSGEFGLPGTAELTGDIRFVFDPGGKLLGQVFEMDGMTVVSVLTGKPNALGQYDLDMYLLEGDEATPYGSKRFERVELNQPVDESLFD